MNSSSIHSFLVKNAALVVVIAATILLFSNTWNLPIYILDEAKNAECAREMWETKNYIIPTFNYELRTDKPPLHYFFMGIAYSIFGTNAFAAHFFSAIMGILTVWITFLHTRRELGESVALFTALVLLSSLHFLLQFHLAVPDPYLIFSITVSIFSFYLYIEKNIEKYKWYGYISAALGVLAKGPIALALIGLVMLLFLIFSRQLKLEQLRKLQIPLGGLLFLSIVLPWYIAVGSATEGIWLEEFFFKHNLNRFEGSMEGHGGGFWVTFLFVTLGLFPFSVFLPQSLHWTWKKKTEQPFLLLCLIASVTIVGFFAVSSTKLPNYTVPAYPFLAVLIGNFLYKLWQEETLWKSYKIQFSIGFGFLLSVGLVLGAYFGLKNYPILNDLTWISWIFLPCSIGFLAALLFKKNWIWLLSSGTIILSLLLFYIALPTIMLRNPVEQSSVLLEGKNIIAYKRFNPAYSFHVQRIIPVLESSEEVQAYFQKNPDAYLLTFTKYANELESLHLDTTFLQQDLFEGTKTLILSKAK